MYLTTLRREDPERFTAVLPLLPPQTRRELLKTIGVLRYHRWIIPASFKVEEWLEVARGKQEVQGVIHWTRTEVGNYQRMRALILEEFS